MVARADERLAATQEIANVVRHLAGADASYVAGQANLADGRVIEGIRHAAAWSRTPPRNKPPRQRLGPRRSSSLLAGRKILSLQALHHPDHCVVERRWHGVLPAGLNDRTIDDINFGLPVRFHIL